MFCGGNTLNLAACHTPVQTLYLFNGISCIFHWEEDKICHCFYFISFRWWIIKIEESRRRYRYPMAPTSHSSRDKPSTHRHHPAVQGGTSISYHIICVVDFFLFNPTFLEKRVCMHVRRVSSFLFLLYLIRVTARWSVPNLVSFLYYFNSLRVLSTWWLTDQSINLSIHLLHSGVRPAKFVSVCLALSSVCLLSAFFCAVYWSILFYFIYFNWIAGGNKK